MNIDNRNTPPSPNIFQWSLDRIGWERASDNAFVSRDELRDFEKTQRVDGKDTLRGVRLQDRLERVIAARPTTVEEWLDKQEVDEVELAKMRAEQDSPPASE